MSKRPSTSASDESGNNPSVAKFMCITENDNKILCKYFEVLQETANKFKMQNANSPQEQNAIRRLSSFEKLFSGIDLPKTLSQATVFCKVEEARSVEDQLRDKLLLHYGFREFKSNQLEIMKALTEGHDVFVRKPTGGGKSLLFNLPCLLTKGIAFVVCPLIALMQDQVQKLHQAKIPAVALHHQVTGLNTIIENLKKDEIPYKVVILTPERALSLEFSKIIEIMIEKKNIAYVAFDECHVIVHDAGFRWVYNQVGQLKVRIPRVPFIAVTATATPTTQSEVISKLGLANPRIFTEGVDRSNISLEVREKKLDKVYQQIATVILSDFHNQTGLVYMMSHDDCKGCVAVLKGKGINAECYYATLDKKEQNQVAWMDGRVKVMVCTVAFAMGIDKPDVRFVIHGTLAQNVEDYYQQFGRAGRDGLKSKAITFYHPHDIGRVAELITKNVTTSSLSEGHQVNLLRLYDLQDYMEMTAECRRCFVLAYFGEEPSSRCGQGKEVCDNCFRNEAVETVDMWVSTKAVLSWLEEVSSVDFNSLKATLKGQEQRPNSICGLLRHWPTDEIGRYLRYVCRHRILSQVSQKEVNKSEVSVIVRIGSIPPQFDSAKTFPFPMKKNNRAAIMALEATDANPVLPQIDDSPLNTQARVTLEEALKQFPEPPPVDHSRPVSPDLRGSF